LEIDPPRFRTEHVAQVPVLVRYEKGQPRARVAGLFDIGWLDRELTAGRSGDLGQHGPTYAITEEDMEERMKTVAAGINWSGLRTKAMTDAWSRVPIVDLPAAKKASERVLDPTITAQQTLMAPDGRVIVRAGDRVNPLERVPFHTRLIVFDASRPEQVAMAKKLGDEAPGGDAMYLFTRLSDTPSWEALHALTEKLGRPAYRFTEAIKARFDVRAVPAVIEARDREFRIYERPAGVPAQK
jgi:conjugal transfer pilus assembly protein TraW